jgi:uncharacterized SAM-binding protein YcdF (DUF218 family)
LSDRRRLRRVRRWRTGVGFALAIVTVVAIAWGGLVFPRLDQAQGDAPRHSQVIYLLGGEKYGPEMGFRMLDEGRGDVLVLSWVGNRVPECTTGYRGHRVVCVEPHPATTQGEAMLLPELMEENAWESVTVATWPAHLPRTRMLFDRCYSGPMQFAATSQHHGRRERLVKAAYETFSFVKAAATPGCSDMLPFGLSGGVAN